MKDQPSRSPTAAAAPRASRWLLCSASSAMPIPAARPAMPIPMRARLSPLIQDSAEGLAGQIALGDETVHAALLDERPEIGCVVARGQDDRGTAAVEPEA